MDPTKYQFKSEHNLQPHHFVPPIINPHKRKTHEDVPREDPNTIHEEKMHPDDHEQHEEYHERARTAHYTSIRKRERMDREEKERARAKSGAADDAQNLDIHLEKADVVDPNKIAKPTPHPTKADLKHMIISVFIRDRWSGVEEGAHGGPAQWMQSAAMALDAEFRDHNVNYQEINLLDHDHIQVLCNDREERDHMKHLLIR